MNEQEALQTLYRDPQNRDAWEALAQGVYQPLVAYVASLLISFRAAPGESAHDIVHDALLAFYMRWPASHRRLRFAGTEELLAYLRRSCRNLLVDRYRRARHAEKLMDFLTHKSSAAEVAERDADRAILTEEIIAQLPEDYRWLVKKYVIEGLSPAEIADGAGISPKAFYARWYRCLEKAKEIFQGAGKNTAPGRLDS